MTALPEKYYKLVTPLGFRSKVCYNYLKYAKNWKRGVTFA